MKDDHAILTLCLHLEVSASGYYDWQRRRLCPGPRALEDQAAVCMAARMVVWRLVRLPVTRYV